MYGSAREARSGAPTEAIVKAIPFFVVLGAAVLLAPGDTVAHHGKQEEHAQPSAAGGGCARLRAGKTFTSVADCMKGGNAKRSCRSACK
jgi:hypothetical protein